MPRINYAARLRHSALRLDALGQTMPPAMNMRQAALDDIVADILKLARWIDEDKSDDRQRYTKGVKPNEV